MNVELEELAYMARGASEREIETEVVQVLKRAGWARSQIKQDETISDKGADKADVVLRVDGVPTLLVEVKKHGQTRDADAQVNRYCRLLTPSPRLAILTDGVRWVFYFVGQAGTIPILEAIIPNNTVSIVSMLTAFSPQNLSIALQSGAFQYLDIVEQGLKQRSEDTQKHLRHFFASTVRTLLLPTVDIARNQVQTIDVPVQLSVHSADQIQRPQARTVLSVLPASDTPTEYDPFRPPPLSFTTKFIATFAGVNVTNWNDLLRVAVRNAVVAGQTIQDIKCTASINIQEQEITGNGFSPLLGLNLSIQGQSADQAWQNALKLAQSLRQTIEVKFCWSENKKAAHPGEIGILRWNP